MKTIRIPSRWFVSAIVILLVLQISPALADKARDQHRGPVEITFTKWVTVLAYSGAARDAESKPQALAAARRSIELDPRSAVGHTALACATLLYENNRAMAKLAFERALELNPHYAQGRSFYALFYLQWAAGSSSRALPKPAARSPAIRRPRTSR